MKKQAIFVSPDVIAQRWGVSSRIVRKYCDEGRIKNAYKEGRFWKIPEDAKPPRDERIVDGQYRRPSKEQQLLLKGLLRERRDVYLIDLENDKFYDTLDKNDRNRIKGKYSAFIEKNVASKYVTADEADDFLRKVSIEKISEELRYHDEYEILCRVRSEMVSYKWCFVKFTICERRGTTPTYAIISITPHVEQRSADELYSFAHDMSRRLREPISTMMGLIEIGDRNASDVELLTHLREKERTALAEMIRALDIITAFVQMDESSKPMKKSKGGISGKKREACQLKVLLVEDNEMNRDVVAFMLTSAGMNVIKAMNGLEAIERYEESVEDPFDLILMDIQMPVMDGYTATKRIRASKLAGSKSIPIIALSAGVFPKDIQNALDAGMNAHLAKPLNAEKLIEMIETI